MQWRSLIEFSVQPPCRSPRPTRTLSKSNRSNHEISWVALFELQLRKCSLHHPKGQKQPEVSRALVLSSPEQVKFYKVIGTTQQYHEWFSLYLVFNDLFCSEHLTSDRQASFLWPSASSWESLKEADTALQKVWATPRNWSFLPKSFPSRSSPATQVSSGENCI